MDRIDRAAFLAGLTTFALAAVPARAADAKTSYKCTARLERVRDKKTLRRIETVVADGKRFEGIDGSWDYSRMPRKPLGLYVSLTAAAAKTAPKVHITADFEYGSAGQEAAGGNNVQVVDSKMTVDDDFDPGTPVAYPWKIAGDDYLLVVSVEPVAPK